MSLRGAGAQIVETLPASEYNTTHIAGAIHMPLGDVIHKAPTTLERGRPVVTYCRDSL